MSSNGIQRTTIDDIISVGDPLYSDNFVLEIPNLPSGIADFMPPTISSVDGEDALRIQCKSVSIPGQSNEPIELNLAGFKIWFAGRAGFPNEFSATFVEDRNLTIYNTIKAWLSMVRDPLTQKSAGKFIYGVIANLHLYDEQLEEIQAQSMVGFFPHDMPDINLDNTTAQLVDVTVQFKYDIPTSNYGGV